MLLFYHRIALDRVHLSSYSRHAGKIQCFEVGLDLTPFTRGGVAYAAWSRIHSQGSLDESFDNKSLPRVYIIQIINAKREVILELVNLLPNLVWGVV